MNDLFKKNIQETEAYIPPNSLDPDKRRLFLNENLLGCSPACLSILRTITPEDLLQYAEGDSCLLKRAISEKYGVDINKILVHGGESELLKQIFQAFLEDGDKVLTSRHSWGYYRVLAELQGAKVVNYDLKEKKEVFEFDAQDIKEAINKEKPKIIVLISPNMPTGNSLKREDLEAILEAAKDSIVILDEAYFGFKDDEADELDKDLENFLGQHTNIIITRTFSKLFALASLRTGYAFCNETIHGYLQKTAPLFGINYLSQLIAREALKSEEYYEGIRRTIIQIRRNFSQALHGVTGFTVYKSDANFVLLRTGQEDSRKIQEYLASNGFLVRDCTKYSLPDFVRITLGTAEDMDQVAKLIESYHQTKAKTF